MSLPKAKQSGKSNISDKSRKGHDVDNRRLRFAYLRLDEPTRPFARSRDCALKNAVAPREESRPVINPAFRYATYRVIKV
ncbi:MAG: hypothetical protein FWH23_00005 [Bacteroidales bacterium]|nr:hypothetical protein [Bacteroidales bacterium]